MSPLPVELRAWPEITLPARFGLLADFHGSSKRAALGLFLAEARPDILIVAGDVQDYEPWPIPTLMVGGNHEDYRIVASIVAGAYAPRNLWVLPDREIVELGGLRLTGISGVTRTSHGPKLLDVGTADWISRQGGLDLVVSHDTPIHFSNGRLELTNESLRTVVEMAEPRLWLSGHHHHFDLERLGQTQIVSAGKWPHDWAILDVGADHSFALTRFTPRDRARYSTNVGHWNEAAKIQRVRLSAAGAQ